MADPRIETLAHLLVNFCVSLQAGDRVVIQGPQAAQPLMREVYRCAVRAGAHPFTLFLDEEMQEIMLKEGNDDQLAYLHDPIRLLAEQYDARIGIGAPTNSRYLAGVEGSRQAISRTAMRPIMATFMRRTAEEGFRWVTTQFPTASSAQDADMSLSDYENFVYEAMKVTEADPIAAWQMLGQRQQAIVDWLKGRERVEVKGANIDMSLSIKGRTFINDEGHFNMPGGEVFTGPVEDSVNGWVRFTYPAVYSGREIDGIELTFKDGRIEQAIAAKNEEFLLSVLNTDAGARYLGEWAIGTNNGISKFSRNILFDEKIGGTLHMAVGAGYPETGSHNTSAVHWDMICDLRDGAEIRADGELFYKGGEFLIG